MRSPILFLTLAVFLLPACVSPPAVSASLRQGTVPRGRSWSARLQGMLGLPAGRVNYLTAYGSLMKFLYGRNGIWLNREKVPDSSAALRLVMENARARGYFLAVARDVTVRGVPPVLLRDRILHSLTLSGTAVKASVPGWEYFTVTHRMVLAYMYEHRAAQLARAGHRSRAARYLKTFLFLWSQEDAAFSPLSWLGVNPKRIESLGIARTIGARFPPLCHAELAGFKRRQEPGLNLASLVIKEIKPDVPLPRSFPESFVRLFKAAFRAVSGHMAEQYSLLPGLRDYRRQLALAGHHGGVQRIGAILRAWLKTSIKGLVLGTAKRGALLRWTREALF